MNECNKVSAGLEKTNYRETQEYKDIVWHQGEAMAEIYVKRMEDKDDKILDEKIALGEYEAEHKWRQENGTE